MEMGVRPSVLEPTRTSAGLDWRRSVNDAPGHAGSRCKVSPTAAPRDAPRESASRSWCICRTSRSRSASAPRLSPRAHARSSPRACSRARGRTSRLRCPPSGCRTPSPRPRPRRVCRCSPRGGSGAPPRRAGALRAEPHGSDRCRWHSRAVLLSHGGGQALFGLGLVDSRQLDDLVPRPLTRNELHRVAGHRQSLGEQPDDGVVRPPIFRRRCNTHLPGLSVATNHVAAGRARGHPQSQARRNRVHAGSLASEPRSLPQCETGTTPATYGLLGGITQSRSGRGEMERALTRRLATLVAALGAAALIAGLPAAATAASTNVYIVTNLVSDVSGVAPNTDSNLVNAWGLTSTARSPWWVADNGMDVSTVYLADGTTARAAVPVASAPIGAVSNTGSSFVVSNGTNTGPATFLFATEDGTILGWRSGFSPGPAVVAVTTPGAKYKGLAIAGSTLYATDFHNGRVDVFNG